MATAKDISLSLVRTIKTTPEKVFAAWITPETLKNWMAPRDDMEVIVAETDPRIGGRYKIVMRERDGREHGVSGIYKELEPGRRISFTWGWITNPDMETLVTIDLRKIDAGTELTLTHIKFADDQTRDMHMQGWTGCVGRLERLFAA
ncbi:MAG: SRPBCC domain-containing protein [Rhizobiales bacterium]|nr:SRPBCC domain-containing protein [Hyphomicrobiales bacterium]